MKQSKIDSVMETICNTAVGYVIAFIVWHFVGKAWGLKTTVVDNFWITNIFTVASLLRQYILRRIFNGRTVWEELKLLFLGRSKSKPSDKLYAVVEGGQKLKQGPDGFGIRQQRPPVAHDADYRMWKRPAANMTEDELADVLAEVMTDWDKLRNDPDFEGHGGSPYEMFDERISELETEQRRRGLK